MDRPESVLACSGQIGWISTLACRRHLLTLKRTVARV